MKYKYSKGAYFVISVIHFIIFFLSMFGANATNSASDTQMYIYMSIVIVLCLIPILAMLLQQFYDVRFGYIIIINLLLMSLIIGGVLASTFSSGFATGLVVLLFYLMVPLTWIAISALVHYAYVIYIATMPLRKKGKAVQ